MPGDSLVGPSGLHHVPISVLHGLGTLTPDLARDSDLGSLGAGLHDESKNTVAGSSHRKASQELVLEGLGLSLRAEPSAGDLLGEDLKGSVSKVESLLDDGSELPDTLSLLAEHILSTSGLDDDLRADGSYAHFDTGVPILSELTGKELNRFTYARRMENREKVRTLAYLVQLRIEDTIRDKLSLLADVKTLHNERSAYTEMGWIRRGGLQIG